jgi:hypothetical protein
MDKYVIDYYIYRNDEWQDREVEVFGNDPVKLLLEFQKSNRLARKATIRRE